MLAILQNMMRVKEIHFIVSAGSDYDGITDYFQLPMAKLEDGTKVPKTCFDWACPICYDPIGDTRKER